MVRIHAGQPASSPASGWQTRFTPGTFGVFVSSPSAPAAMLRFRMLHRIYRENLALATDLYQLTMAYGYWKAGVADKEAVFDLFFRRTPFKGGYAIACGLRYAVDYLRGFRFDSSDVAYLATLTGNDGQPLFEREFLAYLAELEFTCDVDAIPEGTAVFPHEPLVRVRGPIIQCQVLETPLLNLMNFQTLIATKAARVCLAARGEPVLEFGLRRAQGMDGALAASWACHVGGCAATSNVLAGKLFGIPVKGTHAHSWIMSFDSEPEAFQTYAEAMPNNCVFLVDTYDTLEGVRRAAEAGQWLRERGHRLVGIRLDSGDLAHLSIEARKILDAAGFPDAAIVASNDLNEHLIEELKAQGAAINVWGVGTHMVTAHDQPALGGVYKLAAIRKPGRPWDYKVKLSEQAIKVSNPGIHQVRRFQGEGGFIADMIYDEELGVGEPARWMELTDAATAREFPPGTAFTDLLKPVFRGGKLVAETPDAAATRALAQEQLRQLPAGTKRLQKPDHYPVGLEARLHELKADLIRKARA
jgi:nicotinate phosphoribosyltransferase